MKRLIRKSKIYDGFLESKKYKEIFVNPNSKEVNDTKRQNRYDSIRGLVYNDGSVYIWSGDILHQYINNYIKNQVDTNQLHFEYTDGSFVFYGYEKYSIKQMKELIKKAQNYLLIIGNSSSEVFFEMLTSEDTQSYGKYDTILSNILNNEGDKNEEIN